MLFNEQTFSLDKLLYIKTYSKSAVSNVVACVVGAPSDYPLIVKRLESSSLSKIPCNEVLRR